MNDLVAPATAAPRPGRGGRRESGRQAGGGRGPAAGPPMAATVNETRLQRWVVVTALVPWKSRKTPTTRP